MSLNSIWTMSATAHSGRGRRLAEGVYDWNVIIPELGAFHARLAPGPR